MKTELASIETPEQTYQVDVVQMEGHCLRELINVAHLHAGSLGNNPEILIEMLQLFNENHSSNSELSKQNRSKAYNMVGNYLTYSNVVNAYGEEIDDLNRQLEKLCDTF
ncbi:MAG: hypothetical protein ACOYN4_11430 [Bacteroidales bacterium]